MANHTVSDQVQVKCISHTAHPAPNARHFPALDGLRGIAILLVMLYHFVVRLPWSSQVIGEAGYRVCQAGWVGVEVFFVLSGFLITGILDDTRDDRKYFSAFYMRRAIRILPAYYFFLFASFCIIPALASSMVSGLGVDADKQWWFWSFLTNWLFAFEEAKSTKGMYLWSLAVEEQFYLLWPIIVWLVPRKSLSSLCIAGCFVIWISRPFLVYLCVSPTAVYTMTVTHADGLLLGAWLSLAWRSGAFLGISKVAPRVVVGAVLAILSIATVNGSFVFYDEIVAAFGLSATTIASAGVVVATLPHEKRSLSSGVCESWVLSSIGKISFGLYLLHIPAAVIAGKLVFRFPVSESHSYLLFVVYLLVAACLSVVFATCSWHFIELPFLKMKKSFQYGRDIS